MDVSIEFLAMDDVDSFSSANENLQQLSNSYQGDNINIKKEQIKTIKILYPEDSNIEKGNMPLAKYVSKTHFSNSLNESDNGDLSIIRPAMSDRGVERSPQMSSRSECTKSAFSFPPIFRNQAFKGDVKQQAEVKKIKENRSELPSISIRIPDCNKNKEKVLATFAIGDFENFIFHRLSPTIKANKQSLGMFPVDKLQVQLLSKFTKIQDKDGSLYYGQIKGGLRYGFGGQLDACGHYYEGAWLGDERHGFGRYFSAEGDFFFGQFRQGLFEGEGEYHARDGSVYRGGFHNHRRHGYGIELKATGTKYKGQWAEGRRHGKGLLKYANGDTYQGDFKADVFDGQGVYSWADGSKYEGEYLNGKYHGKGVMTLANGNKFVGDYVKGKPNGFGEFHNRDGGIYRGECSHGKPNGKGVFTNAHGKQFQQVFVNGVRVESIAL